MTAAIAKLIAQAAALVAANREARAALAAAYGIRDN